MNRIFKTGIGVVGLSVAMIGLAGPALASSVTGTAVSPRVSNAVPSVQGVSVNPAEVVGGHNAVLQITLSGPAPKAGAVVTLSNSGGSGISNITAVGCSSSSGCTTPPPATTLTVPAGKSTADFTIVTTPVAAKTLFLIGARTSNLGGGVFTGVPTALFTINPANDNSAVPSVQGVSVNPAEVVGGHNAVLQITLSGPAPKAGAVVTLSNSGGSGISNITAVGCSSSSGCTTPPPATTLTVPAGKSTADFTIVTTPVAAKTLFLIGARTSNLGGGVFTGFPTALFTINPAN